MAKTPPPAPAPQPGSFDVNAFLASQPAGGGSGTQDYYGLPTNTADPGALMKIDTDAQAKWAQGQAAAAYGTGSDMMPIYQSWSHQDIDNIQRRLVSIGLLANTEYRSGVWDDASAKAFQPVLGMANVMGQPWQNALAQYETGTPMTYDSKTGTYIRGKVGTNLTRTPVVTQFTNPDDLATAANTVAQNKLGRSFTPDELQRFVRAYHDTEASVTAAQNAAQGGGSYTQAPSPDVAAAGFAQQTDPTAYNAEQFLPLVQKMNQMLSGPGLATTKPMSA